MDFSTVSEWLLWITSIHATEIDLGLDRVREVGAKLDVLTPKCPVIIVGGTNGKGSTVTGIESIYFAAGYRVGAFISPILFKHNEYVRINGINPNDATFCHAYAQVEKARANISLTPFEFFTLGALLIFKSYPLDVLILEVGLGGRLDAVNIINAALAIITTISLDHVDRLGSTREAIAREKAGILRPGKFAICGDIDPPQIIADIAQKLGTCIYYLNKDFYYHVGKDKFHWDWHSASLSYEALPINSLAMQNMANVVMAITLMQTRLPVTRSFLEKGLSQASLPGRIQVVREPVLKIFDVAHNPAAISFLVTYLTSLTSSTKALALSEENLKHSMTGGPILDQISSPTSGKTYAIFSMLSDKDLVLSIRSISPQIDYWFSAPLDTSRAASLALLQSAFELANVGGVTFSNDIVSAYKAAHNKAIPGDRLIVFGSFHTVSAILRYRSTLN